MSIKSIKLDSTSNIGTGCLICGDFVAMSEYERLSPYPVFKICDKCKDAILEMREKMRNKNDK